MARNRYQVGPVTAPCFTAPARLSTGSFADPWRLYRAPFADWPAQVPLPPAAPPPTRVDGATLRARQSAMPVIWSRPAA